MDTIKEAFSQLCKTIYFDEKENLREKFSDRAKAKAFIDEVEQHIQMLQENNLYNKEEIYFLYGVLGNCYRIDGRPLQAIHYLTLALALAMEEGNAAKRAVCMIRLGEAFKYNNDHEKALKKFTEALKVIIENALDLYKDFALQHKGKCFIEMNRWDEAEQCFLKALTMRQAKGIPSLIESTQQALAFVDKQRY